MDFQSNSFDSVCSQSIQEFLNIMEPEIQNIYNDLVYVVNPDPRLTHFYGEKICLAIRNSFRFTIDFKSFYCGYLKIPQDKYPVHYAEWDYFIQQYTKERKGLDILARIVHCLEQV